jgi:hypothetical protein
MLLNIKYLKDIMRHICRISCHNLSYIFENMGMINLKW